MTFGNGSGQEWPVDGTPWIRQPRVFDTNSITTPEQAMAIGAVLSCIKLISTVVGMLPCIAYQDRRVGGRERARDTDLWTLVHKRAMADPLITAQTKWQVTAAHLAGWGEAFDLKLREGAGRRRRVVGLRPLDPSRVTARFERGRLVYELHGPRGSRETLPAEDIVHYRHFSLDGINGLSPIGLSARDLSAVNAESTFRSSLLGNGAQLSGVLTTDRELSAEASRRVQAQWEASKTGASAAARIAVLEGGMRWHQMSAAPRDLEFVAQRQASVADVARIFNVPPSAINAPKNGSLDYSTAEGESMALVKYCLTPGYLSPIETTICADPELCPDGSGLGVEFLLEAFLRADAQTRAEFYAKARNPQTGWMLLDEVRDAENLPQLQPGAFPSSPTTPQTEQ
jgi:HK97 family phage portal protein